MAVRNLRGNVAEVESSQHLHLFKFWGDASRWDKVDETCVTYDPLQLPALLSLLAEGTCNIMCLRWSLHDGGFWMWRTDASKPARGKTSSGPDSEQRGQLPRYERHTCVSRGNGS